MRRRGTGPRGTTRIATPGCWPPSRWSRRRTPRCRRAARTGRRSCPCRRARPCSASRDRDLDVAPGATPRTGRRSLRWCPHRARGRGTLRHTASRRSAAPPAPRRRPPRGRAHASGLPIGGEANPGRRGSGTPVRRRDWLLGPAERLGNGRPEVTQSRGSAMQRFEEKVVLVTGAASGIGQDDGASAAEGATLACLDVQADAVEAVAAAARARRRRPGVGVRRRRRGGSQAGRRRGRRGLRSPRRALQHRRD